MSQRQSVQLMSDPAVQVWDVSCTAALDEPGPEEHSNVTQVILLLDGVFEVHRAGERAILDASSAVIFDEGADHRVGHPTDRGDRCLVLVYPPETLADAFEPGSLFSGPVAPATTLGARALAVGLRRDGLNAMEAEEFALSLLARVSNELGRTQGFRQPNDHQLARIEDARALLATEPARRWRLDELARGVHCSPFHLARQFRTITGMSVSGYLLRLRLALACERLAEGADDLAALAADLGFANHSHFSARFRSVFGVPPRAVRGVFTSGEVAELRRLVTADGITAS